MIVSDLVPTSNTFAGSTFACMVFRIYKKQNYAMIDTPPVRNANTYSDIHDTTHMS